MSLLTPLNVNCHASDGRKSTPLHLAAGYNRTRIVQLLLQHGADVHAKVSLFISLWDRLARLESSVAYPWHWYRSGSADPYL
jgi:ankyrin repeat protein